MNAPLVSVILSVYNGEKYLAEAIESILDQTYKNFEFIIIDDGSDDKSLEIIKRYKDERIVSISRENRGLVESLNEGIKQARGKYIARMDADDIALPSRFEEQVEFMEKHLDVGVCGTAVIVFGDGFKEYEWTLSQRDETLRTQLLFSSVLAHPTVMMRRELMVQHKLFYDKSSLHAEDFELWTRFAQYSKLANIKKPLLRYRVLENSVSRVAERDSAHRYEIIKKITQKYVEHLGITNSEREDRLHFSLSTNLHIKEEKNDFKALERYFSKLIKANEEKLFFNALELKKTLGKKWFWNLYYRKELGAIFSKYTVYGVWSMLTK